MGVDMFKFLRSLFAKKKVVIKDNVPKLPRGVRNKNPGNIRKSRIKWKGMSDIQMDESFITFNSAEYGIRAMMKILITYQSKHKLMSVKQMINRWAPPNENNTDAYIKNVASKLNVKLGDKLNILTNDDNMIKLCKEITVHENGKGTKYGMPRAWFRHDVYVRAVKLAREK